jgi:hypothetical protein
VANDLKDHRFQCFFLTMPPDCVPAAATIEAATFMAAILLVKCSAALKYTSQSAHLKVPFWNLPSRSHYGAQSLQ